MSDQPFRLTPEGGVVYFADGSLVVADASSPRWLMYEEWRARNGEKPGHEHLLVAAEALAAAARVLPAEKRALLIQAQCAVNGLLSDAPEGDVWLQTR